MVGRDQNVLEPGIFIFMSSVLDVNIKLAHAKCETSYAVSFKNSPPCVYARYLLFIAIHRIHVQSLKLFFGIYNRTTCLFRKYSE